MKSNIVRLAIASLVPGLISAAAVAGPTAVRVRAPEMKVAEPKLEIGKSGGIKADGRQGGINTALTAEQAEKLANAAKVAPKGESPANDNVSCEKKLPIDPVKAAAGSHFSPARVQTLITSGVLQQCQLPNGQGQSIEDLPGPAKDNLFGMDEIALSKNVLTLPVEARDQLYADSLGDVMAKNDNVRPTQADLRERVKQIRAKCNFNY